MKKLKIAQYGCGKASVYTMKYVYNSGGEIVAAFDENPNIIGKDIGEIMETEKKGIIVSSSKTAQEVLQKTKPDACILTTMSLLADIKNELQLLASLGINTVTTCEEAFFPWNSAKEIAQEIDILAQKNNCTITGSGFQDMAWCNLAVVLAGSCNKIEKIKVSSSFNIENYGISPAMLHGAGLDVDTFMEQIASSDNLEIQESDGSKDKFIPSFAWNSNGWLCDKLGLTPIKQTQRIIPHTYDSELKSNTLDMTISASYVIGMTSTVTTETKEGIIIEMESIGRIYLPGEEAINTCEIWGDPHIKNEIINAENIEMACASIVGRIPDTIDAPAGFVTSSKMPILKYKHKDLGNYIK